MQIGGPLQFDQGPLGAPLQMPAPQAPKKKTGMFGSGLGIGEALVHALNGYLAAKGNPVGMAGMQMLNQRHQQKADEAKHQQRRGESFEDWLKQQAWKQANPDPSNPHYFEDNSGNLMAIGPDGQPKMVHKDPLPFKLVPNGMGGVVPVDLRALMAQQVPAAPVGKITPIEGGPMPSASGGFPRPF